MVALQVAEAEVLERCRLQSLAAAAANKIRRLRAANDDWSRQAHDVQATLQRCTSLFAQAAQEDVVERKTIRRDLLTYGIVTAKDTDPPLSPVARYPPTSLSGGTTRAKGGSKSSGGGSIGGGGGGTRRSRSGKSALVSTQSTSSLGSLGVDQQGGGASGPGDHALSDGADGLPISEATTPTEVGVDTVEEPTELLEAATIALEGLPTTTATTATTTTTTTTATNSVTGIPSKKQPQRGGGGAKTSAAGGASNGSGSDNGNVSDKSNGNGSTSLPHPSTTANGDATASTAAAVAVAPSDNTVIQGSSRPRRR